LHRLAYVMNGQWATLDWSGRPVALL